MASIDSLKASDGTGNSSVATIQTARSPLATTIVVDTVQGINTNFFGSMGTPHTFTDPITGETITVISEATAVDFKGHVDGANLEIDTIAPGYTDGGSEVGDIVIIRPTTQWGDEVAEVLEVAHDDDGKLKTAAETEDGATLLGLTPTGGMIPYAGRVAPTGWLLCFGQAVSRADYARLFDVLCAAIGTFTTTIATPGVMTLTAHGFQTGDAVYLTTTGSLPTGLTANTVYYVVKIDANTFNLATSRANAAAGTKIATSGSQSGVHTIRDASYGIGNGSTTFNIPDKRGRALAGADAMGGTAAGRLTLARSQGIYGNRGSVGGDEKHLLTALESGLRAHTHDVLGVNSASGNNGSSYAYFSDIQNRAAPTSSVAAAPASENHNIIQPTGVDNVIIKT